MKKALIDRMLPKELSWEERFALARRCGFDGIEVHPFHDPAVQAELRAAAEKTGLRIHSVMHGGRSAPLTDPDLAVREKRVKDVEASLRCAKALGADGILLVTAYVNEKVPYGEAYELSRKLLRPLVAQARELDVTILIENVWNNFLLSPLEFCRFIDEFESPHLQAYFDVGNVVKDAWPEDWIRTLGRRIRKVHIKDYKRDMRKFTPLGEGDVDWTEVRKAFAEIGYGGYATAEVEGGDESRLRDIGRRMDKIIAGRRP